jgi:membrane protein
MSIRSFADFLDFLQDLKDEVVRDRVVAVAGGVTFYALLAVVPAITAMISVLGLVLSPVEVPDLLAPITSVMPAEAGILITEQATRIAGKANETLSLTALVALAIALWSSTGGTKALIEALNIAYDVKETRGFVKLTLVALAFTLGAIVLVFLLGLLVAALPFLVDQLGPTGEAMILVLRWPVVFGVLLAVLAAIYYWAPDRTDAEWAWITPGAVVAAIGVIFASGGLAWYVTNFGSYDETYGSLAAVVVLMLWIWLSTVMVLVGAEINAELDRRTGRLTGRLAGAV